MQDIIAHIAVSGPPLSLNKRKFSMLRSPSKINLKQTLPLFLFALASCTFVIRTPAFPLPRNSKPNLFRGVFHVHTEYSHDSKAPLDFVIKTARKAGLDFVVVTDHNNMDGAKAYRVMEKPNRPLLIFADEISTWHDGHLIALGIAEKPPDREATQELIDSIHQQNGYAIIAHPLSKRKPWPHWEVERFDGLEIFSLSDIYYSEGPRKLLPKAILFPPKTFLKSILKTPEPALRLWDEKLRSGRRISAYGSADAHLKWQWLGFSPENYLLYFQAVTTYVIADKLEEEKIVEALAHGKSFMAFEALGLAQDFSFSASQGNQNYQPGGSLDPKFPISFTVRAPRPADIRLILNGGVIQRNKGTILKREVLEPGVYRAEVYEEGKLWIVANPIYVKGETPQK